MRLTVRKQGEKVNGFTFVKGPIHIGRHTDSQIFLPDRAVSRHHAILFTNTDNEWFIEDLDSMNKTYLNDQPVRKMPVNTGDKIKIGDFELEINLQEEQLGDAINLDDTLEKTSLGSQVGLEPQVIVRRPTAEHAPAITLPAKRARDFVTCTEMICKSHGPEKIHSTLLKLLLQQFSAWNVWCSLKTQVNGNVVCEGGKRNDGTKVTLNDLALKDRIGEAVQKSQFLLLPRLPHLYQAKINSAMIAPIISETGSFGVIYLDNDKSHEHYTLSDLDYLMLIAIHTAVVLENF
ncbi:MAG: FHA domain-containing protein [Phycisphaerae bacterium]|nr:FHA domain-containing protein [Phycisphaerae bacterium]